MTDYEKLLEEVDAWAASLRANGIAPTGWYPRLAAALREVMAERQRALRVAYDLTLDTQTIGEAVTELVRLVRQARTERDTALSDVEAMRAVCDAARFVEHYAADMGDCAVCNRPIEAAGDCCDEECPGRLLRDALRALDARATPSAKEKKP